MRKISDPVWLLPTILLSMVSWTGSCTYHRTLVLSEVDDYSRVTVTTTAGEQVLHEPSAHSDTLRGIDPEGDRQAIPGSEILNLEASGTDVAGTVGLSVIFVGVVAGAVALSTYEMCVLAC